MLAMMAGNSGYAVDAGWTCWLAILPKLGGYAGRLLFLCCLAKLDGFAGYA
jgi:hypothetical protein